MFVKIRVAKKYESFVKRRSVESPKAARRSFPLREKHILQIRAWRRFPLALPPVLPPERTVALGDVVAGSVAEKLRRPVDGPAAALQFKEFARRGLIQLHLERTQARQ